MRVRRGWRRGWRRVEVRGEVRGEVRVAVRVEVRCVGAGALRVAGQRWRLVLFRAQRVDGSENSLGSASSAVSSCSSTTCLQRRHETAVTSSRRSTWGNKGQPGTFFSHLLLPEIYLSIYLSIYRVKGRRPAYPGACANTPPSAATSSTRSEAAAKPDSTHRPCQKPTHCPPQT